MPEEKEAWNERRDFDLVVFAVLKAQKQKQGPYTAGNTGHVLDSEGGTGNKSCGMKVLQMANGQKIVYLEKRLEAQTQQLTNTLGSDAEARSQRKGCRKGKGV